MHKVIINADDTRNVSCENATHIKRLQINYLVFRITFPIQCFERRMFIMNTAHTQGRLRTYVCVFVIFFASIIILMPNKCVASITCCVIKKKLLTCIESEHNMKNCSSFVHLRIVSWCNHYRQIICRHIFQIRFQC